MRWCVLVLPHRRKSATSAVWTDGLIRGPHVLSHFLQSAHSDILTGNYGQKIWRGSKDGVEHTDTREPPRMQAHTHTTTRTHRDFFRGSKLYMRWGLVHLISGRVWNVDLNCSVDASWDTLPGLGARRLWNKGSLGRLRFCWVITISWVPVRSDALRNKVFSVYF